MRSPGMLVGGVVLTSLAPIVFFWGVANTTCTQHDSDLSGGGCNDNDDRMLAVGLTSLVLLGVGIPLIVVGGKRTPATRVSLGPWVSPRQAGLQLRLDM
jgi:hypothetical protein